MRLGDLTFSKSLKPGADKSKNLAFPVETYQVGSRIAAAYTDIKASSFIAGTAGHNTSVLINSSGWRSATLVRYCDNSGLPKMIE